MNETDSIFQIEKSLWRYLSHKRRLQLASLILLIGISAISEILSIGATLPFLYVLISPEVLFSWPFIQPLIYFLEFDEPKELLLPVTILFVIGVILAGTTRLILLWANSKISFLVGSDLSIDVYRRTLYQPYAVHVSRNSSEIISGISKKIDTVIFSFISTTLIFVSSGFILFSILIALMFIDPQVAIATIVCFIIVYGSIAKLSKRRLYIASESIARETTQVVKSIQEGLGGIRDILLDGTQEIQCKLYQSADRPLRIAQANSFFISHSPRYWVEMCGMLLIICLAYFIVSQPGSNVFNIIPTLGTFALAAQRVLPILQQGYSSWSSIQASRFTVIDILTLLNQPLPNNSHDLKIDSLPFENKISLKNIYFKYSQHTQWVLKDLNLDIKKGDRIGIIGTTGCGKSTLVDIILGLLEPNGGKLEVDGRLISFMNCRSWQKLISHVPQSIYLCDGTIEDNIAFGVPKEEVNFDLICEVSRQAKIADVIESWPKKYQTYVGERGVMLSGGQRQRIGIARALYKQASIIIFDEATSALDNETEYAVMDAMNSLDKKHTILIIAHRLTTLKQCNQIVEISNGSIKKTGTYHEIFGTLNE